MNASMSEMNHWRHPEKPISAGYLISWSRSFDEFAESRGRGHPISVSIRLHPYLFSRSPPFATTFRLILISSTARKSPPRSGPKLVATSFSSQMVQTKKECFGRNAWFNFIDARDSPGKIRVLKVGEGGGLRICKDLKPSPSALRSPTSSRERLLEQQLQRELDLPRVVGRRRDLAGRLAIAVVGAVALEQHLIR